MSELLSRAEAIALISQELTETDIVIHANGMICRESFTALDRPGNFYMIGSMGLASSIGLGVADNAPHKRVIVLDGDGNLLMNLGTLAMTWDMRPRNYIHIVLDNEAYGSTGDQPTISQVVELDQFARAAQYRNVFKVTDKQGLLEALKTVLSTPGPNFLLVKVKKGNVAGIKRVSHTPEEILRRVRQAITG